MRIKAESTGPCRGTSCHNLMSKESRVQHRKWPKGPVHESEHDRFLSCKRFALYLHVVGCLAAGRPIERDFGVVER